MMLVCRPALVLIGSCAIALAALGCGGSDSEGDGATATSQSLPASETTLTQEETTVTSDDGALTLVLPAGAMPEGTDVTITAVAQEELPEELSEFEGVGDGYLLEPDGLEFSQPVTATLTLNRADVGEDENGQPVFGLVTFSDAAGLEVLDPTTSYALGGETVEIEAELQHLSWIRASHSSLAVRMETVPVEQEVGAAFSTFAVVNHAGPQGTLENINGEAYALGALGTASASPPAFADLRCPGVEPRLRPGSADIAVIELSYDCAQAGEGTYGLLVAADRIVRTLHEGEFRTHLTVLIDSNVNCRELVPITLPPLEVP